MLPSFILPAFHASSLPAHPCLPITNNSTYKTPKQTHTHTERISSFVPSLLILPASPPSCSSPQSLQGSNTAQCVVATALHHAHHKSFSQLFFTTVTTRLTRRASETLLPRSVARLRLSSHQTPPKLIFTHSSSCMRPRSLQEERTREIASLVQLPTGLGQSSRIGGGRGVRGEFGSLGAIYCGMHARDWLKRKEFRPF